MNRVCHAGIEVRLCFLSPNNSLPGQATWRGGGKERKGGGGVKDVGEMVGAAVERMERGS